MMQNLHLSFACADVTAIMTKIVAISQFVFILSKSIVVFFRKKDETEKRTIKIRTSQIRFGWMLLLVVLCVETGIFR